MDMTLLLNCDLGESACIDSDNVDAQVMPFIDQASIACGQHAGDSAIMAQTLSLARQNKVTVGAHPSYPDRENFGRLSMDIPHHQLIDVITQQIATLAGIATAQGTAASAMSNHTAHSTTT